MVNQDNTTHCITVNAYLIGSTVCWSLGTGSRKQGEADDGEADAAQTAAWDTHTILFLVLERKDIWRTVDAGQGTLIRQCSPTGTQSAVFGHADLEAFVPCRRRLF